MTSSAPPHPPSDARLTLTTLGQASLAVATTTNIETQAVFEAGKPLALLTYLAVSPGRTASREHLTDLLWADVETDDAKHALRQTLWYIRRRLGDSVITANSASVTLVATTESDRDAFLDA